MTYLLLILLLIFGCNDTQTNDELCYTDINSLPEIGGISTCSEFNHVLLNLNDGDWDCCGDVQEEGYPLQMSLNSACPNPFFGPPISIWYSVNMNRHLYLRVINNEGEVVDTLINGYHLSVISTSYDWYLSDELEHGIYRVLLSIDNSEEILCYGDICYCANLSTEECDNLCGTTGVGGD